MANYQYIVLPISGSPYKAKMNKDEDELPFLQDKVDGYIEQIRSEVILHPMFNESWEWVKNLLSSKAKYTIYANEDGRAKCCPNVALFIKGWSGAHPLMGNAVIKMTKKNFDKVNGKVWNTFDEMVKDYEEDTDEE